MESAYAVSTVWCRLMRLVVLTTSSAMHLPLATSWATSRSCYISTYVSQLSCSSLNCQVWNIKFECSTILSVEFQLLTVSLNCSGSSNWYLYVGVSYTRATAKMDKSAGVSDRALERIDTFMFVLKNGRFTDRMYVILQTTNTPPLPNKKIRGTDFRSEAKISSTPFLLGKNARRSCREKSFFPEQENT